MTGQVDEAGRETRGERYAAAWRISRGLSVQAWDPFIALADTEQSELRAEVAGLRTQLATAEELARIWSYKAGVLERHRDVLAGQVAAIRALCDEQDAKHPLGTGHPCFSTDAIRAALVASSPTTPEAPK